MKIVVIHLGPLHEALLTASLVVGLKKYHPKADIFWAGDPADLDLIKYNKQIRDFVDVTTDMTFAVLSRLYKPDICINVCRDKKAKEITSIINPKVILGFQKTGPVNRQAQFFENVMRGKTKTNKSILSLYYGIANLSWKGEGYGLNYYPKRKQNKPCGYYFTSKRKLDDCHSLKLPSKILPKLDAINQFADMHTDDHFVMHAALALRKKVYLYCSKPMPYTVDFISKIIYE